MSSAAAYQLFTEFGMEAFVERSRVELEATGEHARKRTARRSTTSPRRRHRSRASRPTAPPTTRSPRDCSSAPAPSTTTSARCSESSESILATALNSTCFSQAQAPTPGSGYRACIHRRSVKWTPRAVSRGTRPTISVETCRWLCLVADRKVRDESIRAVDFPATDRSTCAAAKEAMASGPAAAGCADPALPEVPCTLPIGSLWLSTGGMGKRFRRLKRPGSSNSVDPLLTRCGRRPRPGLPLTTRSQGADYASS